MFNRGMFNPVINCSILSSLKNCIEKSAVFLFQSPTPKTKPNEGKLMAWQFTGPEIISHCRFLPNNKSITIMIYPCNFFINIYAAAATMLSPPGTCQLWWIPHGDWRRIFAARVGRRPAPELAGPSAGTCRPREPAVATDPAGRHQISQQWNVYWVWLSRE